MSGISILILTYNEDKHIKRCINSVSKIATEIIVIDSFSNDSTVEIARECGATVYQNPWINYAKQFNFGLSKVNPSSSWVMRIDSDEYLMDELVNEINSKLVSLDDSVNGLYIKRRVHFMGHWIKHGDYYPIWLLRIWRNGQGVCEERWMDEHIKLSNPNVVQLEFDLVDDNKNNLTWWTEKHNNYATREAIDLLNYRFSLFGNATNDVVPKLFGNQVERKRWMKHVYAYLPLFVRPFSYYIYRYFFKLGFLDGKPGFLWHLLQGFWYRLLVDAKIFDIKRRAGTQTRNEILRVLKQEYGVKHLDD